MPCQYADRDDVHADPNGTEDKTDVAMNRTITVIDVVEEIAKIWFHFCQTQATIGIRTDVNVVLNGCHWR